MSDVKKDQWEIVYDPEDQYQFFASLNGHKFLITAFEQENDLEDVENNEIMERKSRGTCTIFLKIPLLNSQVKFIKPTGEKI